VAQPLVSAARDEILARVRSALADVPAAEQPDDVVVARDYRTSDDRPRDELVALLCARLIDYKAQVRQVAAADVGDAVSQACAEMGLRRVVVADALPAQWLPGGVEVVADRPEPGAAPGASGLSASELDEIDGAVTGCAAAIAETGTIVLDGGGRCGRRAITLVPDNHICVVGEDQVVGLVPEAIARLAPAVGDRGVPVTLISGPSASSDIELTRVEGVHGPRHLLVLIAR
jgi:L-lactate dehydrogenase complex protein LldG